MRKSQKINAALAAAREAKRIKACNVETVHDDIPIFAGSMLTCTSLPPVNLVGAALLTGTGYTQLKRAFQLCDIKVCAESTFYEAQKKYCQLLNPRSKNQYLQRVNLRKIVVNFLLH